MTGPLNFSTKIAAKRTVQECMSVLADAGADAVAAQYRDKQPVGLSFRLETPRGPRDFAMPVDIDGVFRLLQKSDLGSRNTPAYKTREHAANVAWRVVKDWLEAQLAIIAAEMATLDQVMLPYLQVSSGRTLYEAYLELDGNAVLEVGAS